MHGLRRLRALLGAAAAAWAFAVHAGAPLVTDDANVVDAGTCQLESWVQAMHGVTQYLAVPACNAFGGIELGVAAAQTHADDGRSSQLQIQAKTVFVAHENRTFSLGAEAGAQRDTGAPHGSSAFQTYYAKGLASLYPADGLEFDLNLGAANTLGTGTYALAGAAVQYALVDRVQLLGEIYRDEPGRAKYEAGLRFVVIPDRLEAFISYGNRFGAASGDGWATAGVRLQSPVFLP